MTDKQLGLEEDCTKGEGSGHPADAVFLAADLDKNGTLTKSELKKQLKKDPKLKNTALAGGGYASMFADLDEDGDGTITRDEWRAFYDKRVNPAGITRTPAAFTR